MCKNQRCRMWINSRELKNCLRNVKREYTLEEVGEMLGLTKQAISVAEHKAMLHLGKEFFKVHKGRKLRDVYNLE